MSRTAAGRGSQQQQQLAPLAADAGPLNVAASPELVDLLDLLRLSTVRPPPAASPDSLSCPPFSVSWYLPSDLLN